MGMFRVGDSGGTFTNIKKVGGKAEYYSIDTSRNEVVIPLTESDFPNGIGFITVHIHPSFNISDTSTVTSSELLSFMSDAHYYPSSANNVEYKLNQENNITLNSTILLSNIQDQASITCLVYLGTTKNIHYRNLVFEYTIFSIQ